MDPVEIAIRAACTELGADPETWRGFENIGRAALIALADALPLRLGAELIEHLKLET